MSDKHVVDYYESKLQETYDEFRSKEDSDQKIIEALEARLFAIEEWSSDEIHNNENITYDYVLGINTAKREVKTILSGIHEYKRASTKTCVEYALNNLRASIKENDISEALHQLGHLETDLRNVGLLSKK